jgi:glycerophosphoryl diester phosphodiesterase
VSGLPALIRVGHKGADAIVAGNTLASFDAALHAGVDMIEFDVLAERPDGDGELFVVHDHRALARGGAPTLDAALAHLRTAAFAGIRLQVDLKRQGYEPRVLDALTMADLRERTLITTGEWRSLERVRSLDPSMRIGWTVPATFGERSAQFALRSLERLLRAGLPARAAERLRAGAIDALVPQWPLVTPALVAAVLGAGGELYAWTVDDPGVIRRLEGLGVTGVISNDPRLFAAA